MPTMWLYRSNLFQVADLSRFAPPVAVPGECPRQFAFVPRRPLPLTPLPSPATGGGRVAPHGRYDRFRGCCCPGVSEVISLP